MIAFITSVGEKTTEICKEELLRMGFKVIVLDEKKSWYDKFVEFIFVADKLNEPCIRIDADIIPNDKLREFADKSKNSFRFIMTQAKVYDFYKNGLSEAVVFYNPKAIKIIKANLNKIDKNRPEATSWRLPLINELTATVDLVVGSHGYFQDEKTRNRAKKNKIDRKQIGLYRFDLVDKLLKL